MDLRDLLAASTHSASTGKESVLPGNGNTEDAEDDELDDDAAAREGITGAETAGSNFNCDDVDADVDVDGVAVDDVDDDDPRGTSVRTSESG